MPRISDAIDIKRDGVSAVRVMARGVQVWPTGQVNVPDPDPDPDNGGLPVLGFSLNGASLSGPLQQSHYNNLAAMTPGMVWARLGFSSDGSWQSLVSTYVGAARAAGMKILLRASFTNAVWSGSQPLDASAQAAYGDFVRDLALYAKNTLGLSPNDVVFEHPNEMNGRVSGAAYAAAAANAYPKLKSVDPAYKIIGASENVYASGWQGWLQDVYAAGYASASDGVSFHNYDAQNNRTKYTFLENLMKQYNHWPAMVWLSEFGATTPPGATGNGSASAGLGGSTEAGQAVRITGVLEYLRDELPWVTHAFIYADEDIPSRKESDPFEAYFGIYRNDSNGNITGEKPAVNAVRQLYANAGSPPTGSTITLSSSVLSAPTFPVRIDTADNRNFIDAAGKRYYGIADTGWAAMNKLSRADFTEYATKRREQGFTMLFLSVLRLETRSDAENNRTDAQYATGKLPFSNMSDLSTPLVAGSDTYWDHIEWCVDECKRLGLVAVLVGAWYGYQGNAWRSTVASSTANAASYGSFLASRLGDRNNIWWLMGGDAEPGSALAATNAMASALKSGVPVGNHQLMTYHTGRNMTTWDTFGSQSWYDLHPAYSGVASGSDTNAGVRVQTEYSRSTVKPAVLVEDYYDKRGDFGASPNFSRVELRNQIWQTALAGGFAAAHGNEYTWRFVSGWKGSGGLLADSANVDTRIFSRVMNTWITKRFLADHSSPIITSGRGSGTTTAHGIRSTDNTVGVVYIPDNSRTITINLSLFSGAKSLAWVNPQTGALDQFTTGITTSGHTVTSPNTTGDAVLIIQAEV